jgi:hypothetical protein
MTFTHFLHEIRNINNLDAPRCVAITASVLAVYFVTLNAGIGIGIISATLTTLCISPLFTVFHDVGTGALHDNAPSRIFDEVQMGELQIFREEEHTLFGRLFRQTLELCNMEELVYIACVLRENRGLFFLLLGGVASMMMALLAGLEDVNILNAFFLSVSCYGLTTVIVARSARTVVNNNNPQEAKLSHTELRLIMNSIAAESFLPEEEITDCDAPILIEMLNNRSDLSTDTKDDLSNATKDTLIALLSKRRNYNESCCICLSTFGDGETIRVLPSCHHEFHKCCIDKWALTFASRRYDTDFYVKRGKPTCPLCNVALKKGSA